MHTGSITPIYALFSLKKTQAKSEDTNQTKQKADANHVSREEIERKRHTLHLKWTNGLIQWIYI